MRAFKLQNHIKSPNADFDCEEFRFNHRFSAFQSFTTPPVCMYHQYREKDEHFINSFSIEKIYSFAQEHFDLAKTIYEKYPEVLLVSVKYYKKLTNLVNIVKIYTVIFNK